MKGPMIFTLIIAFLMLVSTVVLQGDKGSIHGTFSDRSASRVPDTELVLDRIVEVPPGGETRLVLPNGSDPYLEGFIGPSTFTYGKLGQAADLLPTWLRDDFVRNMLKAGSYDLSVERANPPTDPFRFNFIPSFGDLDGDEDEDMVVGLDGSLYFYKNVGSSGYPIFVKGGFDCPEVYDPRGSIWISPEICDFDGDEYGDIIIGTSYNDITFIRNPGISTNPRSISWIGLQGTFEDHFSPSVIRRFITNITVLFGARNGRVYQIDFSFNLGDGPNDFDFIRGQGPPSDPTIINSLQSLNYSAPRSWTSTNRERNDMTSEISLGAGDGKLACFRVDWPISGGDPTYIPIPNYFNNIDRQGPITPAPFDLDGDQHPDIVLGSRDTYMPKYINYHSSDMSPPYWAPSGTIIPPSPLENYLSVFDRRVTVFDESQIERYLDNIISPMDPRYRDEIGFACAYTPPEMLSGNRIANILNDNVYNIYSRESELEYVSLKEYGGDDYYTTASYWVDAGGTLKQMEIPMDAYYWGIVHPRITEEPVAYVDPESGGEELPENGGRFWREYIYEHADESYPQGPEYPSDYTGRYVYYPRDFSPPLLKDELKDVEVFWDLQPYEYPAGFNDAGTEFNYPIGHKAHAIEKVSQWVERTLPLNQQESLDNERPNQPVRIAHHHNGNCGELQDLTIAAARCALIPARGVNLPGEDHVWSEFYCGGWQQWDNYWSDGGGVIANDMNYWWGWGNRGGSGIFASMGTGETVDVGERYRSPEVQGSLTVIVRDNNGHPVDGARVVLLSHWMMDNLNVDVGPYQGPPPVSVPFPSVWGYSDDNGECTLTAWQQEFNLKVTSELGQFYSEKFTITSDEQKMEVQLQGLMPSYSSGHGSQEHPIGGGKYLVTAEVLGSLQPQTQLLSGEFYYENIGSGNLIVEFDHLLSEDGTINTLLATYLSGSEPYVLPLETGNFGVVLKFRKWGGMKTTSIVRIKVFEIPEGPDAETYFSIVTNPLGSMDRGFRNGPPSDDLTHRTGKLLGSIIGTEGNVSVGDLSLVLDEGAVGEINIIEPWNESFMGNRSYDWAVSWWSSDLIPDLDEGKHTVELLQMKETGDLRTLSTFDVLVIDQQRPAWEGSSWERSYPWGCELSYGAALFDPQSLSGYGWLDSNYLWTADPAEKDKSQIVGGIVDSSNFGPGGHQLRLAVLDRSGNLRTINYPTLFVPGKPELNISSPSAGYGLTGDLLVVRGEVHDDVELSSMVAEVNGTGWDLLEDVDEAGFLETTLEIDSEPGPLVLTVSAVDNVGLVANVSIPFTLLPPVDMTSPIIEISDPPNGRRVTMGDVVSVRGRAIDDTSISRLDLYTAYGRLDLMASLNGNIWSADVVTDGWSEGSTTNTVRGSDLKGNIGTDEVRIEVVIDTTPSRDLLDPELVLDPLNGQIELGERFLLTGRVMDDGTVVGLHRSMDLGDSYEDITSDLMEDGSFSLQVDTSELASLISLTPDSARSKLSDYSIYIMAEDASGKRTYAGVRIPLTDTKPPAGRFGKVVFDGATDEISLELIVDDRSAPGTSVVSVMDGKGRTVAIWEVMPGEFRYSEGEWHASMERGTDLPGGTYELRCVLSDAYDNKASISRTFSVEGAGGAEGPGWALYAASFVIMALASLLLFLAVSAIARKVRNA